MQNTEAHGALVLVHGDKLKFKLFEILVENPRLLVSKHFQEKSYFCLHEEVVSVKFYLLGVQISSCGFARDGVTTLSFHRSVLISMRWKAVISR